MAKRVYYHPVAFRCSGNCVFCISKHQTPKPWRHPSYPPAGVRERLTESIKSLDFDEIEMTGGGEPLLDPDLVNFTIRLVREAKPSAKIKLYTNGLQLVDIDFVDELNISRMHPDPLINSKFMRPKAGSKDLWLSSIVSHFRSSCRTLRVQMPLLKGGIETPGDVMDVIEDRTHSRVDKFMIRELFHDAWWTDRFRVKLDRAFANHAKDDRIKWDFQDRPCLKYPFISADGTRHRSWEQAIDEANDVICFEGEGDWLTWPWKSACGVNSNPQHLTRDPDTVTCPYCLDLINKENEE